MNGIGSEEGPLRFPASVQETGCGTLFRDFGRTTERARKTRQRLVDRLATELDVHARTEEETFYPAVDRIESLHGLVEESRDEHAKVKALVAEVQGLPPDDAQLETTMKRLRDAVLHHASDEEEKEMFPRVEEAFSREDLDRLGRELQARKPRLLHGVVGRMGRAIEKTVRKAA